MGEGMESSSAPVQSGGNNIELVSTHLSKVDKAKKQIPANVLKLFGYKEKKDVK